MQTTNLSGIFIRCFLILFIGFPLLLSAQVLPKVQYFSNKDGLSHHWVADVMQDSRGFIWLSTNDGLNRYDGHSFKVFRPAESAGLPIAANWVYWAEERPDSSLLLSTQYGLLLFDPRTENFATLPGTGGHRVIYLLEDEETGKVICRQGGFVYTSYPELEIKRIENGTAESLLKLPKPTGEDYQLLHYNGDEIWLQSFEGDFYKLDLKQETWEHFPITDKVDRLPLDKAGRFYFFDKNIEAIRSVPLPDSIPPKQWSGLIYDENRIWLFRSDEAESIFVFDLLTESLEERVIFRGLDIDERPRGFQPLSILEDSGKNIWLSAFQGVVKIQYSKALFTNFLGQPLSGSGVPPVGFSSRDIGETTDGKILVRSEESWLSEYDPKSGRSRQLELFPLNVRTGKRYQTPFLVSGMITDNEGTIWLSSAGARGLIRYHPEADSLLFYPIGSGAQGALRGISKDYEGNIWFEIHGDLFQFDINTRQYRQLPGRFPVISYGSTAPNTPFLWTFFDLGLIRINLENSRIDSFSLYTQPRDQRAIVWTNGYLWLATSRGLVKVNPQDFSHRTYARDQGLPGNFVYSLLAQGDYLWLGTSEGLCRFNVRTDEAQNFYLKDGLPHYEFNSLSAFEGRDGCIYMGTLNGVTAFYPEELKGNEVRDLRVLWSEFQYYDTRLDSIIALPVGALADRTSLRLAPHVTNFTIKLALNSFAEPAGHTYAWWMEGLDKDWIYAGNQNSIVYNHLPPGSYTFHAKASDPFGNWSNNELAIAVTVVRPWYSRWWASLAYALLITGLLLLYLRFQLARKLAKAENERLRELDRFKSHFFANITHEFRTPLTVIMGTAGQLVSQVGDGLKPKLNLIHRNGENLLRLINQILDLAKLESKSLQMDYVHGDILAYLRYVAESLHSLANAKNLMVRVTSEEARIMMDYDPERFLYIVHNLLSNAIKFTASGGKILITATVDDHRETPEFYLQVSDTGLGIAPEDLPHIFDRFYQSNNRRHTQIGGSGIGLSLTRELVKAMNGTIQVKSELGRGTTFAVRLPITKNAEAAQIPEFTSGNIFPPKPDAASSAIIQVLGTNRPVLLLIEDNPDVVEYMTTCLRQDYQLLYAYNGRAGIDAAFEHVPDIIISDVMMPEKDGFEVVEILKKDDRSSHIPIILLTARAELESRLAGLQRGADAYLAKPFQQEELIIRLEQLLENRRRLQRRYGSLSVDVPAGVDQVEVEEPEDAFVIQLKSYYEEKLSDPSIALEDVCREMNMGRTNLNRKLQALTGRSAMQLLRHLRLIKAKKLLEAGDLNISEVAFETGFNDPKYFSRAFSEEFGHPPSALLK